MKPESKDPRWGLMMEETLWRDRALECKMAVVVSASYGRFRDGACMPVRKPGPKTLG